MAVQMKRNRDSLFHRFNQIIGVVRRQQSGFLHFDIKALEARGHVYTVPKDIFSFDNDIAEMNTYPQDEPRIFRNAGIPLYHTPLQSQCALNRINHAVKFGQQAFIVFNDTRHNCCLELIERQSAVP